MSYRSLRMGMRAVAIGALAIGAAHAADVTDLPADQWSPGERVVREKLAKDDVDVTTLRVWPGDAPDEPRPLKDEVVEDAERGGVRITMVTRPSITIARPRGSDTPTPAVIVCPGGGYGSLGVDNGGVDVIRWLNQRGVTGVYMKYRVPKRHQDFPMHHQPLQDIQRAVCLLRTHAAQLRIDPARIGAIGFSAGGHLVAMLATNHQPDARLYKPVDDADTASCRPDFVALVAPAYLTMPIPSDQLDPALRPDAIARNVTPPVFIASATTDKFTIGASHFMLLLRDKRVPVELHTYEQGGHAEGIHEGPNNQWPVMFEDWMKRRGILESQ